MYLYQATEMKFKLLVYTNAAKIPASVLHLQITVHVSPSVFLGQAAMNKTVQNCSCTNVSEVIEQ